MGLFLDVSPGDSVRIGPDTVVSVKEKSGARIRLAIETPRSNDISLVKAGAAPPISRQRPDEQKAPTLTRPQPK